MNTTPSRRAHGHGSAGDSAATWAALVLLLVGAGGGVKYYELYRDLDSLQDRAQIAANPADMLLYMRGLASNMAKHSATSGHTALLLKTPANDLALHFQAVNAAISRLEQLQSLPVDSDAYQSGLDDLRGIVRETPRLASGVFWVRFGWWMGIVALACVGIISSD